MTKSLSGVLLILAIAGLVSACSENEPPPSTPADTSVALATPAPPAVQSGDATQCRGLAIDNTWADVRDERLLRFDVAPSAELVREIDIRHAKTAVLFDPLVSSGVTADVNGKNLRPGEDTKLSIATNRGKPSPASVTFKIKNKGSETAGVTLKITDTIQAPKLAVVVDRLAGPAGGLYCAQVRLAAGTGAESPVLELRPEAGPAIPLKLLRETTGVWTTTWIPRDTGTFRLHASIPGGPNLEAESEPVSVIADGAFLDSSASVQIVEPFLVPIATLLDQFNEKYCSKENKDECTNEDWALCSSVGERECEETRAAIIYRERYGPNIATSVRVPITVTRAGRYRIELTVAKPVSTSLSGEHWFKLETGQQDIILTVAVPVEVAIRPERIEEVQNVRISTESGELIDHASSLGKLLPR